MGERPDPPVHHAGRGGRAAGKSEKYKLSEAQVKAILELRLHRLTALGRDEIGNELQGLATSIGELLEILANRARLYEVMREEFDEVEAEFATPRVTELAGAADGIEDEDLIEREDMVVTVTMAGYIKRTPLSVFREQKRGGKGRAGMATKEEDAVTNLFVTSTHNPVLFFSNLGRVYRMKVWRLPEGGPNTRGRPMVNLLPLAEGETISTVLALPEDETEWGGLHIMFATAHGTVRRNSMAAFTNIPSNGKIAMRFGAIAADETESDDNGEEQADPTDRLIGVELLTEGDDVLLATRHGKAIRFMATDVREFQSRTSTASAASACSATTGSSRCRSCTGSAPARKSARAICASRRGRATAKASACCRPSARRACRKGAVHPHRDRKRLRQALLGL